MTSELEVGLKYIFRSTFFKRIAHINNVLIVTIVQLCHYDAFGNFGKCGQVVRNPGNWDLEL